MDVRGGSLIALAVGVILLPLGLLYGVVNDLFVYGAILAAGAIALLWLDERARGTAVGERDRLQRRLALALAAIPPAAILIAILPFLKPQVVDETLDLLIGGFESTSLLTAAFALLVGSLAAPQLEARSRRLVAAGTRLSAVLFLLFWLLSLVGVVTDPVGTPSPPPQGTPALLAALLVAGLWLAAAATLAAACIPVARRGLDRVAARRSTAEAPDSNGMRPVVGSLLLAANGLLLAYAILAEDLGAYAWAAVLLVACLTFLRSAAWPTPRYASASRRLWVVAWAFAPVSVLLVLLANGLAVRGVGDLSDRSGLRDLTQGVAPLALPLHLAACGLATGLRQGTLRRLGRAVAGALAVAWVAWYAFDLTTDHTSYVLLTGMVLPFVVLGTLLALVALSAAFIPWQRPPRAPVQNPTL